MVVLYTEEEDVAYASIIILLINVEIPLSRCLMRVFRFVILLVVTLHLTCQLPCEAIILDFLSKSNTN